MPTPATTRASRRTATPRRSPARSRSAGRTGGRRRAPSTRPTPAVPSPTPTGRPTGQKFYLMDMFPYPCGAGLHVGHPLGFIGTDVLGRFLRMTGRNVLHTMGFDAFGLPAEQYAVQTGTHPRATTEANIARYRAQIRRLGLAPRPAPLGRDHRRRLLPLDAVDLPADLRLLVRRRARPGPADHRARGRVRVAGPRRPPTGGRGRPRRVPSRTACSTTTASPTWPRRPSTGARRSARCSPTRRSPPTAAASAATSPCTAATCASG